jgi:O-acetylhomoserine/O-acetylserine sulfhydrylase-like pyridoxal-dependent enzyme
MRSSLRTSEEQEGAYRAYAGDGLVGLSVGLEGAGDVSADLEQMLG